MERTPYELIILMLLFLSAFSIANAKEVSFAPAQLLSIDTSPGGAALFSNIVSADMDNDGDKDIIISQFNGSTDEISWLENDGIDLTAFPQHIISTTTQDFNALKAIDLDGDGDIDVVGTDKSTNELLWFENNGTASAWATHVIFGGANLNNVKDLSVADLDSDGDLDVVVAADTTPNLYWYQNAGDSLTWTENNTGIVTAGNISSITTGDVTNDGTVDIVYGLTSGSPYIKIVANVAAVGTVWLTSTVATGLSATIGDIQIKDLDLNGLAEIYYLGNNSDLIQLTYDLATSSWNPLIISSNTWGEINFIDFDKDGDTDILVGNSLNFSWLENDDSLAGSWTEHVLISGLSTAIKNVHATDLDNDGDMEVIIAKEEDGFVYAYENLLFHSSAQFDLTTIFDSSHTDAYHVVAGLLNGDQYPDIISANNSSTGMEIFFFAGDGSGGYAAATTVLNVASTTDSQISAIQLGDMDKDGDIDIVFAAKGNENIYLIDNQMNAGPFAASGKSAAGVLWGSITTLATASGQSDEIQLADINADGMLDVVAFDKLGDRIIWLNNDGLWTQGIISDAYNSPLDLAVADFNNDGTLDVAVSSNSTVTRWFSNDNGDGSSWIQNNVASHTGYQIDVADMDSDGDIDIIASRNTGNTITWYANNGTGTSWQSHDTQIPISSFTRELQVEDVNKDGKYEILTQTNAGDFSLIAKDENSLWSLQVIQSGLDIPSSFTFTDSDFDGDLDITTKGSLSNELITIENRGGQYSVDYSLPPAQNREDSQTFAAASFTVSHNGTLLDGDMQISTFHLGFIAGTGCSGPSFPSSDFNPLISNISVYRDDGSGSFELFSDTLVYDEAGPFTLVSGQITLNLPDQNTDLQIFPQTSKDYFIALKVRPTASTQTCHGFEIYPFISNAVDSLVFDTFRAQDRDSLIKLNGAFTTEVIPEEQLIVASTNNAPITTGIADKISMEALPFTTDISTDFSDADGDTLSFSAGGLPLSLTLNANTGIITGTPTATEATNSPFNITVIATDPQGATTNSQFNLVVNPFVEEIFTDGME